jgi:putative FmdB family regulatory protein
MPTYVYECGKCGDEFELYQSFSDDPLKKHPGCGGKVAKVLQPVGIVFKGSGFHRTDSRSGAKRSRSNGAGDKESSDQAEKPAKADTSASDTKSSDTRKPDTKASGTKASGTKASGTKAPGTKSP